MPPKSQKKKKAPQNPFFFFMLDFRDRQAAKGIKYGSLAEVTGPAGLEWEQMDSNARAPYDKKAKDSKKNNGIKYTTTGEPIHRVLNRDEEREKAKRNMEEYIENIVFKNVNNDGFADKNFYVAHVNYYCEVTAQERYYPAEIAVVRFNLRNGVDSQDAFHVIFNTGEVKDHEVYQDLPIGYRLTAEMVAKESHQIPPPPHKPELGSITDIKRSFSQLIDFLRQDLGPGEEMPPIYVEEKNDIVAKNVFKWLSFEFGYDENMIKVYSLPFLFYCLRNAAHMLNYGTQVFINKSIAVVELERDIYDFVKGICCPFHSSSDAFPFCSLSKTIRQVYIICDFCCPDIGIDLVPGSHVPMNANHRRLDSSIMGSRASSRLDTVSRAESVISEVESVETIESALASSSITSSSVRRVPQTESRLLDALPDLKNDFPSLPGPRTGPNRNGMVGISLEKAGRRTPIGRGRGRLLDKTDKN